MDQHGVVVEDAPVYIYGAKKGQFLSAADIPGSTTFTMKEGRYSISSALVKRSGEYVDRFASNEAHIQVVAGDNVSIVLRLAPVENPEHQAVSYGTLHMAGLPGNLLINN